MMGEENNSSFYPDFKNDNSNQNLVPLRRSRSAFIGSITRLVNKIDEKLSLNYNLKQLNV